MRSVGKTMALATGICLLGGWLGCESGGFVAGAGGAGTGSGAGGGSGTQGVGMACSTTGDCRSGLACDGNKHVCEPGHATPAGGACILNDECAAGLSCAAGHCAKGGSGMTGGPCASDADCATGLRCTLVGLAAECEPEGSGDVGAKCATINDCLGGLSCTAGMCSLLTPGMPFGTPWPGVQCDDATGQAQAYFEVPRATGNHDFYRLPFPNDIRLKNGHPSVADHPTPGSSLLGYDVVARYLSALGTDNDGWGVYHTTFFRFSAQLDFSTLNNNVNLVDLTANQPLAVLFYYSIGGSAYICPNWLGIRQGEGLTYTEGHTYAAYITTSVTATGGAPVSVSSDLTAMLGAAAPADATLAAAHPAYAPLRAYLTKQSIAESTILDATVFTVGHPTAPVPKLEAVIDAAPAPVATQWVKCDTGVKTPCPDATGDRACPAADPDFDELHALVALPIFQSGTAPYLTPSDGGGLNLDKSGTPAMVTTQDVCLSLTVPKGTMPAGGWPTLVYAHGTGGDFRSAVTQGISKDFAVGVDDGTGNKVQAAVLGIDQVQTGPRRNGSTMSSAELFFNFANPAAAKGNVQQGAADQMSLGSFVPSVVFTAGSSPTGAAFSLGGGVAFWGQSQGATAGSVALPFGKYAGAVLSGQGASVIDELLNKTNPVNVAAAVPFVFQDVGSKGELPGGQNHPVLSLLQTYLDGADPLGYAVRAAAGPRVCKLNMGVMCTPDPAGLACTDDSQCCGATNGVCTGAGSVHHVFQPYGLGDTYAPPVTQATYALAAAFGLVAADPSVTTPDGIGTPPLSTIPTPAKGNLTIGGKPVSALIREYKPGPAYDGDFVSTELASAKADVERFLAGVMSGIVPQVGK